MLFTVISTGLYEVADIAYDAVSLINHTAHLDLGPLAEINQASADSRWMAELSR